METHESAQEIHKYLCPLHFLVMKTWPSLRKFTDSLEPSLRKNTKYGCYWRLRPKFRPLAMMDTLAWAYERGFCAYAIRTESSCAGTKYLVVVKEKLLFKHLSFNIESLWLVNQLIDSIVCLGDPTLQKEYLPNYWNVTSTTMHNILQSAHGIGIYRITEKRILMRVCACAQTRMSLRLLHTQCLDVYLTAKETHINQHSFNIRSKEWVWSGNTTITNWRQTHGTARNSHTTITRHQEDKLSKASSSLSPSRQLQN